MYVYVCICVIFCLASPIIQNFSESRILMENDNVTIFCTFISMPISTIKWFTESGTELVSGPTKRIVSNVTNQSSDGYFERTSTLTLTDITRSDSMNYLCVASNGIAKNSTQINQDRSDGVMSKYSATATVSLIVNCEFSCMDMSLLLQCTTVFCCKSIIFRKSCMSVIRLLGRIWWEQNNTANLVKSFKPIPANHQISRKIICTPDALLTHDREGR